MGRWPAISTCLGAVFFFWRPGNSFGAAERSTERIGSGRSAVFTGGRDSIRPGRPYRSGAISDATHFGREQDGSMGDRSQFFE